MARRFFVGGNWKLNPVTLVRGTGSMDDGVAKWRRACLQKEAQELVASLNAAEWNASAVGALALGAGRVAGA